MSSKPWTKTSAPDYNKSPLASATTSPATRSSSRKLSRPTTNAGRHLRRAFYRLQTAGSRGRPSAPPPLNRPSSPPANRELGPTAVVLSLLPHSTPQSEFVQMMLTPPYLAPTCHSERSVPTHYLRSPGFWANVGTRREESALPALSFSQ